jgi:16S rRNA (cytosine967-C5)-methyltransferase
LGLSEKRRAAARPQADGEPPGLAARRTAVSILRQVTERGVPLDALLDEGHGNPHYRALEPRDRALVRAILGAALRRRGEIEVVLAHFLDRPLPEGSGALSAILHVGAAQILFLDIPDHAAVSLAVAQAGADRRTGRARGLVNSVLRRIARERTEILARGGDARANTPGWLFARWTAAYGEAVAAAIAAAHLEPPPLDLSVRADAALWAERLGGTLLPTGTVRLAEAGRVPALPGYEEGAWWVQDAAAALPARMLGEVRGKRVADLCAAPGGKTGQLAAAGAEVTAVDISEARLRRLAGNLSRLGLQAQIEAADVLAWQPGRTFHAVLLDAPCTATGTIRRHPDIPWLKREEDVATLAALQARLLDRAADLVSPGGILVFCTCSLEPEEGEAQITPFLSRQPDFQLHPIASRDVSGLSHLLTPAGTLRTLPCHAFGPEPVQRGMDGFFAARFRRS